MTVDLKNSFENKLFITGWLIESTIKFVGWYTFEESGCHNRRFLELHETKLKITTSAQTTGMIRRLIAANTL